MGKYEPWNYYFRDLDGTEVSLTFDQLEEILGKPLPASAFEHQPWWSNTQPHAAWSRHGWAASPDMRRRVVRFSKARSRQEPAEQGRSREPPPSSAVSETQSHPPSERRAILLGCVSRKAAVPSPAKDLYVSDLWQKRRAYAESTGHPWFILSAEHGLIDPDATIAPYDRSLKNESTRYRQRWSQQVSTSLISRVRDLGLTAVEIHAGAAYVESGLLAALNRAGVRVYWPLRGMRIGEQLSWYGRQAAGRTESLRDIESPAPPASAPVANAGLPPQALHDPPSILHMERISSFTYRWPDAEEQFEYGWEGVAIVNGRRTQFRHGMGGRVVYGVERRHTVTWLDSEPTVEGVAADDYAHSRGLLSRVRRLHNKMARTTDEVPPGYDAFPLVEHRSEIDAPYSPNGFAVKLREDDVAGWLLHATLKRRNRTQTQPPSDDANQAVSTVHPAAPIPAATRTEVARALLEFAESEQARADAADAPQFTPDPEAEAFLRSDPFAFLIAVICDQGIKAERAWAVPYELDRRLGHLNPHRLVEDPEVVNDAFKQPPALHRYVEKAPRWVVSAAERVIADYDGDAARIWSDQPEARTLRLRLERFDGIGQKKAAMAVEILEHQLGIPITDLHGSDIAYDIHVRRVFLRTGLATRDDMATMVAVGRELNPERPGALDLPAWIIGRTWCRPSTPDCHSCALSHVCPRYIERGDAVKGA